MSKIFSENSPGGSGTSGAMSGCTRVQVLFASSLHVSGKSLNQKQNSFAYKVAFACPHHLMVSHYLEISTRSKKKLGQKASSNH